MEEVMWTSEPPNIKIPEEEKSSCTAVFVVVDVHGSLICVSVEDTPSDRQDTLVQRLDGASLHFSAAQITAFEKEPYWENLVQQFLLLFFLMITENSINWSQTASEAYTEQLQEKQNKLYHPEAKAKLKKKKNETH